MSSIMKITGQMLRAAIIAAANALNENKAMLDAMNVFPVPDGDTGTNMYLTALSAAVEAEKTSGTSAGEVAKAAAAGALRGARGNSGVILSQLYRGIAKALDGVKEAGSPDMARALTQASETAYKAIMKPKEGTILTVAREAAEFAEDIAADDMPVDELFVQVIKHSAVVLMKTKEMLPALAAANVEDAGGKGYLVILEGMYGAIAGESAVSLPTLYRDFSEETDTLFPHPYVDMNPEDIEFCYCTELFIIPPKAADSAQTDELLAYLDTAGDSIVVVSDEDIIKIHVHTNNPGHVLEKALAYGALDNIKIQNMRVQFEQNTRITKIDEPSKTIPLPVKDTGFVAVASGKGFMDIFTGSGADYVIEGGQSMNPSADDFLNAINAVRANAVIILPNNKNVILAARQAASLCKDKEVHVIQTRSMPQGLAALTGFVHTDSAAENAANMEEAIKHVHSGLLTKAVRNTTVDNLVINKGDAIAIIDGRLALRHKSAAEAAKQMADEMIKDGIEFVTVYFGQDVKQRDADRLADYISENYPDVELELHDGGQPLYRYIISAE